MTPLKTRIVNLHIRGKLHLSKAKAIIAPASIGLIALFVMPGFEGAYRLSKWGMSGFALLILSAAFLFSIRNAAFSFIPKERRLFLIAVIFAASAIALPAGFTQFTTAHYTGSLRLLMGLSFAYLTALSFNGGTITKDNKNEREKNVPPIHPKKMDGRGFPTPPEGFPDEPEIKRLGLKLIVVIGGICSIIVIMQAAGVTSFLSNTHFTSVEFRSPGTFGNPNWAVAFLLPLAPISFGLIRHATNLREKYLFRILTVLIVTGTIVTLSKSGILALMSGITIFILLDNRMHKKTRRMIFSVLFIVTATIILLAVVHGYFSTLPGSPSWMRGRIFLWKGAFKLIADHLLAGTGLGGYLPSYPYAAARVINGDSTAFMPLGKIDFLHNDPLQFAVEGGLLTGFLYLVLIFTAVYKASRHRDPMSRGTGAAVAAIFFHGFADSPLQLPASFMLFWFLMGWIMAGNQDKGEDSRDKNVPPIPKTFACVILIISLLSLTQFIRFIGGNILWSNGRIQLAERKSSGVKSLQVASIFLHEVGDVRYAYANALNASGLHREALYEIDSALRVYSDFDAMYLRLRLLEKINGSSSVIEGWNKLSREFPLLVTPHYELGSIYLSKGDKESAVKEFMAVLNTNQDTARAMLYQEKVRQFLQKRD